MAKIAQTRQRMLELEQQLTAVQVELDLATERIAELEARQPGLTPLETPPPAAEPEPEQPAGAAGRRRR